MEETEYTLKLAEYCSNIQMDRVGSDVLEHVKYLCLDFLGLAAKGLPMESSQKVHSMILKIGGSGDGTIIGTSIRPLPQYAALANAAASHSMSLDDIYTPASIHPGSAIFAAALAASEWRSTSGTRFLEGAVAGYETTLRIADAVDSKSHYDLGWHPTATCGTFGATAAVSRIIGLNAEETASAFGIAGSMASGLMAFMQDGSWTKRIHPGLSAQRGIQAAQLAAEGFKGPKAVLEGKWGFLSATSKNADTSHLIEGLGKKPRVMDTGLKLHACCRYNQSAIDATVDIMKQNDLSPQMVESVQVEIFKAAYPLVVDPWEEKMNPKTDVQAQFSLPYTVALAAVKGRVSFEEFNPDVLNDPAIHDMMKRVSVVHNPELDPEFPERWPTLVTIQTKGPRSLSQRVDYPKGDIKNPLSWEELIARFNAHSEPAFTPPVQTQIVNTVQELQDLDDMNQLTTLIGKTEDRRQRTEDRRQRTACPT